MRSPHNPDTLVKEHIRLLHRYNEVKDTTQSLIYQVSQSESAPYSDTFSTPS